MDRSVSVVPSLDLALKVWTASTRASPLFTVDDPGVTSPTEFLFRGKHVLIFLGPLYPALILPYCPKRTKVWVSLGLFNVIVSFGSRDSAHELTAFVARQRVAYERWNIEDGIIVSTDNSKIETRSKEWRKPLMTLSKSKLVPELIDAVQEYCPLVASTLSRTEILADATYSGVETINQFICSELVKVTNKSPTENRYEALGQLLTINAALSRFASQTFGGASPISETECHFWSHSLLGIGLANVALWKLRRFLETTLGYSRLPQRFAALRNSRSNIPDLLASDWPEEDFLGNISLSGDDSREQIIPLLSYFSARDGYRSTEMTISAPLATVSSCSSTRWSLLTITHEVSHVIIRAILSELYPDLSEPVKLDESLSLLEKGARAESLFHEIRRLLLYTIACMDNTEANRAPNTPVTLTQSRLRRLLEHWRHEVDETMVHVFDFLYFYGGDVDRYVSGIWTSWGTIPNVSTRVRGYVIRTICAVLAKHLRRGQKAEITAKEEVVGALERLKNNGVGGRYVDDALAFIENEWQEAIRPQVLARRQLVKIVRFILFSEKIATSVRGESAISGDATEKEGYTLKPGVFDGRTIRNPLRFLQFYTGHGEASSSNSAWMLHVLAFCIE